MSEVTQPELAAALDVPPVLLDLPPMEALRLAVSAADAGMKGLASDNPVERIESVLDFANLLAQAKRVVLGA